MTADDRREYKRNWDQLHRDEINARKRAKYREDMQDPAKAEAARARRRERYLALKADPERYAAQVECQRRKRALRKREAGA